MSFRTELFTAKSIDKMDEEKKQSYIPYVETLKGIKQSIQSSIQYELISQEGDIEEIKVTCSFPYYENTISSLVKTVEVEIFNRHIRSSNFMSTDIVRVANPRTIKEKDHLKFLVNVYKHVVKVLEEAKKTIFIDGIKLEIKED